MKLHIEYWKKSAKNDWKTSHILFKAKRYDACLFFCHLTLEKIIKGLVVVKTRKAAPHIHNLEHLSVLAKLDISEEQRRNLQIITTFNVAGRYPDEKLDLYEKATKQYAQEYLTTSKSLYLWLKKHYQKK